MKWKTGNVYIEGMVDFDTYLPMLRKWYDKQEAEIAKSPPTFPPLPSVLMGAPLWGETYVRRFLDICVPSLLAQENIAALKNASALVLFVDKACFKLLRDGLKGLETSGVYIELHIIPKNIVKLEQRNVLNKYWLLGTVQNLCLRIAAHKGMGFHMLMPDHVYSQAYFRNLYRLAVKHEAIAQATISGDLEPCLKEIEPYRNGNVLTIPGPKLGEIVFRHMHKQNHSVVMNNRDYSKDMPDSHFYFFVGADRLHIYCPHLNVAYMSPRLVYQAPERLHNAMDTELPAFMPCDVYTPTMEDDMAYTELSDDSKLHQEKSVSFSVFALRCWMTTHFRTHYERFSAMKNVMPIGKQYDFMTDEQIDKVQGVIHESLINSREEIYDTFLQVEEELAA